MRPANIVLSALCMAAVVVAVTIAWRGRNLRLVTDRPSDPESPSAAAQDAVRSVATVLAAGLVAGVLVVGLGGRLVMRALAATSGDAAQCRLTEADQIVGEITLDGSVGFVLFAGLLLPAGASFIYLAIRRFLPDPVCIGGLIFGLLLLATFGVDDPLSPTNVDFRILSPLPLAVALVAMTALLFGVTFAALAARLDVCMSPVGADSWSGKLGYLSLVALIFPPYLLVTLAYVAARAVLRGRVGLILDERRFQLAGRVLVLLAAIAATIVVIRTTTEIV